MGKFVLFLVIRGRFEFFIITLVAFVNLLLLIVFRRLSLFHGIQFLLGKRKTSYLVSVIILRAKIILNTTIFVCICISIIIGNNFRGNYLLIMLWSCYFKLILPLSNALLVFDKRRFLFLSKISK